MLHAQNLHANLAFANATPQILTQTLNPSEQLKSCSD